MGATCVGKCFPRPVLEPEYTVIRRDDLVEMRSPYEAKTLPMATDVLGAATASSKTLLLYENREIAEPVRKAGAVSMRDPELDLGPMDHGLLHLQPPVPLIHEQLPPSGRLCSAAQILAAIGAGIVLLVLGSAHLHGRIAFGGITLLPGSGGLDHGVAPSSAAQRARLRVTNGCAGEEMWLARSGHRDALRVPPSHSYDVEVPHEDTSTLARFWPRFRCDEQGRECAVGSSSAHGNQALGHCAGAASKRERERCAARLPAADTKVEVSFGRVGVPCNASENALEGCDIVNAGVQAGFTVPFRLKIRGDCDVPLPGATSRTGRVVDCSGLSLDQCPEGEAIGRPGGQALDLRLLEADGAVAGCYSPCSRLMHRRWEAGLADVAEGDLDDYCCPTAAACRNGPASQAEYTQRVHSMCPGANAYHHDSGISVGTCPAGTKYEMVFLCPSGSAGIAAAAAAATPPATSGSGGGL